QRLTLKPSHIIKSKKQTKNFLLYLEHRGPRVIEKCISSAASVVYKRQQLSVLKYFFTLNGVFWETGDAV
ncbi:hypothetical protein, partial [Neisseria meningitidis]|uniref:hypothetical protein n=1 Tax=Neisseria meningitidis TaxID=487 RepID=UPI000FF0BA6F